MNGAPSLLRRWSAWQRVANASADRVRGGAQLVAALPFDAAGWAGACGGSAAVTSSSVDPADHRTTIAPSCAHRQSLCPGVNREVVMSQRTLTVTGAVIA